MSAKLKTKIITPDEYLALEEAAEYRSEYEDGEIVAMAGGTLGHARIVSNISRNLGNKLSNDCESLTTDVKIWAENYRKFYYPDVLVICGEPLFYEQRNDTLTNPVLIFEVLSKSTEAKDRGEKFAVYQSIESLQEYVLVSQDAAKIEKFVRQTDESWKYQATIGLKSKIVFESINVGLSFEEIYQRIKF